MRKRRVKEKLGEENEEKRERRDRESRKIKRKGRSD